jgi:Arc/MetJ-type ribon-helix-helix transcriptional regulator
MTIALRPQTEKLLQEQMDKGGFATPDDAVRTALQALDELRGEAIEDLDQATQAAIDRALAQAARGEGRPWSDVRAALAAKHLSGNK